MLQKMKKISLEKYVLLLPPSKSLKKYYLNISSPKKKQLFVGIQQRQSLDNYTQPCTIFQDV